MPTWKIEIEGRTYEVAVRSLEGGRATVVVDDQVYDVGWDEPESASPATSAAAAIVPVAPAAGLPVQRKVPLAQQGVVSSPLPGLVLDVLVKAGDTVERGQVVAKIEAMKMANEIRASLAGTVAEVLVAKGDTVEEGAQLLRIG